MCELRLFIVKFAGGGVNLVENEMPRLGGLVGESTDDRLVVKTNENSVDGGADLKEGVKCHEEGNSLGNINCVL